MFPSQTKKERRLLDRKDLTLVTGTVHEKCGAQGLILYIIFFSKADYSKALIQVIMNKIDLFNIAKPARKFKIATTAFTGCGI